MLKTSSTRLLQLAGRHAGTCMAPEAAAAFNTQQYRFLGGDRVPQYWGKPSPYTEGTTFLGTPPDHMKLIDKRPLSPDVFEIDNKSMHYKFPLGAITSILNRVTGVALTAGFTGASYLALTGDLPGALVAFKANYPLLVFPAKAIIAYPIIYHYLGGMRHFVWDLSKIGNNADHHSLLEPQRVEQSSMVLLGSSAVLTFIAALL